MNNIPKISVIVPVYNVEKYLSACLESLAAQTLEEVEIVANVHSLADFLIQHWIQRAKFY